MPGPLTPAGARKSGRQVQVQVPAEVRDALHREADENGTTASELIRERCDAAAAATPLVQRSGEQAWVCARLSQDRLDAIEYAARSATIEPTVWLRLVTTQAGRVLLAQLQAAHGGA